MKNELTNFKSMFTGKIAILSSLLISGYWIFGNVFNVYTYAVLGAIYEILWIFMIPMLFVVPLVSATIVILDKFKNSYFYLMSVALNMGTFFWLYYGQ